MFPLPGLDWIDSFEEQPEEGGVSGYGKHFILQILTYIAEISCCLFFFHQPCFCTFVRKRKTLKTTSRTASLWLETAAKRSPTSQFYLPSIKHTTAIRQLNCFVNWGFCFFQNFVVSFNRFQCDCSECGWKDIVGTHTLIALNQFGVPSLIRVCSACLFSTF